MKSEVLSFLNSLSARLNDQLPAHDAHRKIMSHRKPIEHLEDTLKSARQSAILIFIYPHEAELRTVFIKRASYKGVHSGQIAFPGGKVEQEDRSLVHTALREAEEEVAIPRQVVSTLGSLSPLYVPPSNFLINPFVGFGEERPNFIPQPSEVEAILEAPLVNFVGDQGLKDVTVTLNDGQRLKVKGFQLEDQIIWGATAMILKEFSEILEEVRPPIW